LSVDELLVVASSPAARAGRCGLAGHGDRRDGIEADQLAPQLAHLADPIHAGAAEAALARQDQPRSVRRVKPG
jgi:hypothetical protein